MKQFLRLFLLIILISFGFLGFPWSASSQEVQVWTNLGLYGGQISDIAIDPSNSNKIFAGSYLGDGLFVTKDGGISWQAVETDNNPVGEGTFKNHAVYQVKIAHSNNNVIWVAHNVWVEKSTDGGQTWTHISNSDMQRDCQNCGGQSDNFRLCKTVAIDPSNPDIVYVGTAGPLNTYLLGAIYKTENGGKTWMKMNQGVNFNYTVMDIDIDPQDSSIIWAVTSSYGYGGWASNLYRSTDKGDTWTVITAITGAGSEVVRVKPNDSNTVFIGGAYGLMKNYFDGTDWQSSYPIPDDYPNFGCRLAHDIEFDPQDPEVLYVSWRNPYFGDYLPRISTSTNGGTDFVTHVVNYEFQSLAVHPTTSNKIYGGDLNLGVYNSQDSGQTWTAVNNGINAVVVYDVQNDPADSNHILAGTQSGLYEKKPDEEWTRLTPYKIYSVEFDPVNSLTFYAGLDLGYLAKTTDGGLNWGYSYAGISIRSIAVDPVNTDTIFIAGSASGPGKIQKSTDGGATFATVLEGVNQSSGVYAFNSVAIDPSDHFHIFAGGGNFYVPPVPGDLWESKDGGGNWTRSGLQNVTVNDVLIDPQNPDIMYAGCGYSSGTDVPVYKSIDGGRNWTASYEGIPGSPPRLRDAWGTSPSDFFVVGSGFQLVDYIFHYDGSVWTDMSSGVLQSLYGVWGTSKTDVFVVGTSGTILHFNGSAWSAMNSGTTELLKDVWGTSGTNVFGIGNNGTILRYNGYTWSVMNSGTTEALNGIWGSSDTDVFAVGDNGIILHYNGSAWALMNSGTTELLEGVWGSSDTDVFAVGDNGTILHYNGSAWALMNSGTTELLEGGVWGSSDSDVFAVGDNGIILHYNGSAWALMNSGTIEPLSSIWGASGADVFVTSSLGTVIHFGGGSWTVIKQGGKPWNSVTDLEFHRQNTNVVYASTYLAGVYVSPNQARNWLNLGTPDYNVYAISTSSLYAATEGGLLKCTGTGVIAGLVADAPTGKGIDHASVYTDLGNKCISINGEYMMVCPAGIFDVTAVADDHANKTIKNLTVSGGDVSWAIFSMEPGNPLPSLPPQPQDTSGGSSNCFIATAAYGSPLAKQVKILRQFRDRYLLTHTIGQKLVALYYRTGKPAAMYIESHPWLKLPIRVLLYPLVGLAWLLVSTSAKTKWVICLCILICGMVGIRRHRTKRKIAKKSTSGHAINIMLILFFSILIFEGGSLQAATLFQSVGVASSPNPVGSGARAVGMGGSFIGVADDATAASWNPAGLIQLERPEVSIVGDYNYRKEEFTSSSHPEIDNMGKVDEVALNYFSATYPFHFYRNMVVSINYQRLYDFKRNFDHRYDYSLAGLNLEQYKSFSQDGSIGALGLAAAVEITPKLSLGVTLNIWTDRLLWENGWDETYTEHGVGTLGGVSAIIDTQIHDKYSQFRGVNANFGLLWHITEPLTVGAVVKTPFTASLLHEFDSGETQTIGGSTTVLPSTYLKEDVDLDMPMSYGIGIACRFSDAFSIDVDVYRTLWSKYILTDDQGNEFSPIDGRPKSQSQVKDTTQVRIGGEYLFIKQNMNMVIPVRAGFFYDPEPSEGSPEDFFGVAIGSGIAYKQFIFDVAYQFRWGNDVDTGNLIATSKADIAQHTILTSIIVHF